MNNMEEEKTVLIENITEDGANNGYTPKTPIWKSKMFLIITGICITAVIAVITTIILIAGNGKSDIEKRLETANRYLLELDYEQAKAEFEKIIKADPKCVEAYIGLAEAYEGLGEPDKAREVLEEGYEKTKSEKLKALLDKEDDTKQMESDKEDAEPATDEEETTLDESDNIEERYEIINNGGTVVKYGSEKYYWKYNNDSYENQAVFAEYSLKKTTANELVCESQDGTVKTLLTATASNNLYFLQNRLYFDMYMEDGKSYVSIISREAGNWNCDTIETLCKGKIYAADDELGVLVFHDYDKDKIMALDVTSNTLSEIAGGVTFLKYESGNIYYQEKTTDYENAVRGEIRLCVSDVEGNSTLLVKTTPDLYGYAVDSEVQVLCIQIYDEYVYYSYGGYSGSGHLYQPGNICRVSLDGSDNQVLVQNAMEYFYVYSNSGKTKLIYTGDSENRDNIRVKEYDIESKQVSDSTMNYGMLNVPSYVSGGNYSVYKDTTGVSIPLISADDYTPNGTPAVRVKDIELIGNEVYYSVVLSKYNEAVSIGWRDGYDRVKTEVYKKNLDSGEVEKIYEY